MRRHPHLYEINTRTFVTRLSAKYRRALTLATIPDDEWRELKRLGFDLVWLMGVWQRSPLARQLALVNDALRREFDAALPGWTPEDVVGSAYAIYDYRLDPDLGRPEGLARLKAKLNRIGLGLVVDFVPNHLALDHPWTLAHPERFVRAGRSHVQKHPGWFFRTGRGVRLAHGRDPNFLPWHDTVQVNFFSPSLRKALAAELKRVAELSDGARCDMAMLALNNVFARVWGEVLGSTPQPCSEFWTEAIEGLRKAYPDYLLIAEVYWGLERRLQDLGFDFTYDKSFYDRLRYDAAADIREWLTRDGAYREHAVHFIENHDEMRAMAAFGRERSLAAAIIVATIPGMRFFHEGQLQGWHVRVPVHLARGPSEAGDSEVERFYARLLSIVDAAAFHEGEWSLIEAGRAWDGNESHRSLLAWQWQYDNQWKIVVVNYSASKAQGWLRLTLPAGARREITFCDELTGVQYLRNADELLLKGLYVDLSPYQAHIMGTTV